MAKTVKLEIITPSKLFYKGEVELVVVKTLTGEEGFMAGHVWACKLLDAGAAWIQETGTAEMKVACLSGGYIDVEDSIMIYTDAAEWHNEISVDRANMKMEEAKEFIAEHGNPKPGEDVDVDRARWVIEKSKARLAVAASGGKRKR